MTESEQLLLKAVPQMEFTSWLMWTATVFLVIAGSIVFFAGVFGRGTVPIVVGAGILFGAIFLGRRSYELIWMSGLPFKILDDGVMIGNSFYAPDRFRAHYLDWRFIASTYRLNIEADGVVYEVVPLNCTWPPFRGSLVIPYRSPLVPSMLVSSPFSRETFEQLVGLLEGLKG